MQHMKREIGIQNSTVLFWPVSAWINLVSVMRHSHTGVGQVGSISFLICQNSFWKSLGTFSYNTSEKLPHEIQLFHSGLYRLGLGLVCNASLLCRSWSGEINFVFDQS